MQENAIETHRVFVDTPTAEEAVRSNEGLSGLINWVDPSQYSHLNAERWRLLCHTLNELYDYIRHPERTRDEALQVVNRDLNRLIETYQEQSEQLKAEQAAVKTMTDTREAVQQSREILRGISANQEIAKQVQLIRAFRARLCEQRGIHNTLRQEHSEGIPTANLDPAIEAQRLPGLETICRQYARHSNEILLKINRYLLAQGDLICEAMQGVADSNWPESVRDTWGAAWALASRKKQFDERCEIIQGERQWLRLQHYYLLAVRLERINVFLTDLKGELLQETLADAQRAFNGVICHHPSLQACLADETQRQILIGETAEYLAKTAKPRAVLSSGYQAILDEVNKTGCYATALEVMEVSLNLQHTEHVGEKLSAKQHQAVSHFIATVRDTIKADKTITTAKKPEKTQKIAQGVQALEKNQNWLKQHNIDAGELTSALTQLSAHWYAQGRRTIVCQLILEVLIAKGLLEKGDIKLKAFSQHNAWQHRVMLAFEAVLVKHLQPQIDWAQQEKKTTSTSVPRFRFDPRLELIQWIKLKHHHLRRFSKHQLLKDLQQLLNLPGEENDNKARRGRALNYLQLMTATSCVYPALSSDEKKCLETFAKILAGNVLTLDLEGYEYDDQQRLIKILYFEKILKLMPELNLEHLTTTHLLPILRQQFEALSKASSVVALQDFEFDQIRCYLAIAHCYLDDSSLLEFINQPIEEAVARFNAVFAKPCGDEIAIDYRRQVERTSSYFSAADHPEVIQRDTKSWQADLHLVRLNLRCQRDLIDQMNAYVNRFDGSNVYYGLLIFVVGQTGEQNSPLARYVEKILDFLFKQATWPNAFNWDWHHPKAFFDSVFQARSVYLERLRGKMNYLLMHLDESQPWWPGIHRLFEYYALREQVADHRWFALRQRLQANDSAQADTFTQCFDAMPRHAELSSQFLTRAFVDNSVTPWLENLIQQEKQEAEAATGDTYEFWINNNTRITLLFHFIPSVAGHYLMHRAHRLAEFCLSYAENNRHATALLAVKKFADIWQPLTKKPDLTETLTIYTKRTPWSSALLELLIATADPTLAADYFCQGIAQLIEQNDIKATLLWRDRLTQVSLPLRQESRAEISKPALSIWQSVLAPFFDKQLMQPLNPIALWCLRQYASSHQKQTAHRLRFQCLVARSAEFFIYPELDLNEKTQLPTIKQAASKAIDKQQVEGYFGEAFLAKELSENSLLQPTQAYLKQPFYNPIARQLFDAQGYGYVLLLPVEWQASVTARLETYAIYDQFAQLLSTEQWRKAADKYPRRQEIKDQEKKAATKAVLSACQNELHACVIGLVGEVCLTIHGKPSKATQALACRALAMQLVCHGKQWADQQQCVVDTKKQLQQCLYQTWAQHQASAYFKTKNNTQPTETDIATYISSQANSENLDAIWQYWQEHYQRVILNVIDPLEESNQPAPSMMQNLAGFLPGGQTKLTKEDALSLQKRLFLDLKNHPDLSDELQEFEPTEEDNAALFNQLETFLIQRRKRQIGLPEHSDDHEFAVSSIANAIKTKSNQTKTVLSTTDASTETQGLVDSLTRLLDQHASSVSDEQRPSMPPELITNLFTQTASDCSEEAQLQATLIELAHCHWLEQFNQLVQPFNDILSIGNESLALKEALSLWQALATSMRAEETSHTLKPRLMALPQHFGFQTPWIPKGFEAQQSQGLAVYLPQMDDYLSSTRRSHATEIQKGVVKKQRHNSQPDGAGADYQQAKR